MLKQLLLLISALFEFSTADADYLYTENSSETGNANYHCTISVKVEYLI